MVKNFNLNLCLGLFLILLILWQILLPGYILTLDMVFTPKLNWLPEAENFLNTLPLIYFLKLLNVILPGWIIQKLMIITLFLCLFYLALKYLQLPKTYYAKYWGALLYTVNPFVYERFLAGHWTHLFGYAFLPLFIHHLFKFAKEPAWRNTGWLIATLFLIGIFSLHFLVMTCLISIIYIFYQICLNIINKNRKQFAKLLEFSLIFGFCFLILNSYWLVPYLLNQNKSIINNFTPTNIEIFKTANDFRLGTSLNVLALYGYWGESQPWAHYWHWPKTYFSFWSSWLILLFSVISVGIYYGLKNKEHRSKTIFFLLLGFMAFIFSCGLGETWFLNLNRWLFKNIVIWRGFRDTNKFTALLILSYAYLGSLGFIFLKNFSSKFKLIKLATLILFSIPLLYTYPMLGGFSRQLQPVWYPQSWQEVNLIIKNDSADFETLFLPWHGYLSLLFNHNLITANPASSFFERQIIASTNIETNGIVKQTENSKQEKIDALINTEFSSNDETINEFKKQNIKYIIMTHDLNDVDNLQYNFLSSSLVTKIYQAPEISLYQIN